MLSSPSLCCLFIVLVLIPTLETAKPAKKLEATKPVKKPKPPILDVCNRPKKIGPCKARLLRYFFDSKTGKCTKFFYGGCRANANNFRSRRECLRQCGCRAPQKTGRCEAAIPRYYYHKDGKCKKFNYGGCGANDNNFRSLRACQKNCGVSRPQTRDGTGRWPVRCRLPKRPGKCIRKKQRKPRQRFYFSPLCNCCKPFTYSGCRGNRNNFRTMASCNNSCRKWNVTGGRKPRLLLRKGLGRKASKKRKSRKRKGRKGVSANRARVFIEIIKKLLLNYETGGKATADGAAVTDKQSEGEKGQGPQPDMAGKGERMKPSERRKSKQKKGGKDTSANDATVLIGIIKGMLLDYHKSENQTTLYEQMGKNETSKGTVGLGVGQDAPLDVVVEKKNKREKKKGDAATAVENVIKGQQDDAASKKSGKDTLAESTSMKRKQKEGKKQTTKPGRRTRTGKSRRRPRKGQRRRNKAAKRRRNQARRRKARRGKSAEVTVVKEGETIHVKVSKKGSDDKAKGVQPDTERKKN